MIGEKQVPTHTTSLYLYSHEMPPKEAKMEVHFQILIACVILIVSAHTWKILNSMYFKPKRLEKLLRSQGFKGNPYRFPYGDLKEYGQALQQLMSKPLSLDDDIKPRAMTFAFNTMKKHGMC